MNSSSFEQIVVCLTVTAIFFLISARKQNISLYLLFWYSYKTESILFGSTPTFFFVKIRLIKILLLI